MSQTPTPPTGRPQPVSNTKMLVIAFVLALAAVIMVILYTQMVRAQTAVETITVFTLRRSVEPGDMLDRTRDIREVRVPKGLEDAVNLALNPVIGDEALRGELDRPVQRSARSGTLLTYPLFRGDADRDRLIPDDGRVHTEIPIMPRYAPGTLRQESFINIHAPFPSEGGGPLRMIPVLERVRVVMVGQVRTEDVDGARGGRAFQNITIDIDQVDEVALENIKRITRDYGEFAVTVRSGGRDRRWDARPGQLQINPDVIDLLRSRFNIDLAQASDTGRRPF